MERDWAKYEATLPEGHRILKEDVRTQEGDLLYAGWIGGGTPGWRDDNIVDSGWAKDGVYPMASLFICVARRA